MQRQWRWPGAACTAPGQRKDRPKRRNNGRRQSSAKCSGSLSHRMTGARPPSQDVRYPACRRQSGSAEAVAGSNFLILFFIVFRPIMINKTSISWGKLPNRLAEVANG
jgi:hypothetical protein